MDLQKILMKCSLMNFKVCEYFRRYASFNFEIEKLQIQTVWLTDICFAVLPSFWPCLLEISEKMILQIFDC